MTRHRPAPFRYPCTSHWAAGPAALPLRPGHAFRPCHDRPVAAEPETSPQLAEPSAGPRPLTREPGCPKHMVFGPCGGVRADLSCEMATHRCPFTERPLAPQWAEPAPEQPAGSALLDALE